MVRIERLRQSVANLRAGRDDIDEDALMELFMVRRLYEQFAHNPAWEKIREQAKDGNNFVHDIFTLAFVALTAETDTGINLREVPIGRACDVLIAVSTMGYIAVEVKAPQALQEPTFYLTEASAWRLVRDKFDDADTGKGGQLNDQHPGMLVIGAWHLTDEAIELLKQAALRWFERHKGTKQHIFGAGFLFLNRERLAARPPYSVLDQVGFIRPARQVPTLETKLLLHFAHNPYYTGAVKLRYV